MCKFGEMIYSACKSSKGFGLIDTYLFDIVGYSEQDVVNTMEEGDYTSIRKCKLDIISDLIINRKSDTNKYNAAALDLISESEVA